MANTEKMNRLHEFLPLFWQYLSDEAIDSILYISVQEVGSWKDVTILVGIDNIDYKCEMATFESKIIIDIQEHLNIYGMTESEQNCTVKRVNCFELN